jgi:putative ABC transport system permease protein
MNTSWKKIMGDIRANRAQLVLVIAAIAVGALALSTAFSARTVMTRELERNYRNTAPTDITLWLANVPPLLVNAVAQRPDVARAEARRLIRARAKINAIDWRPLRTFVIADFANLRVSTFRSVSGKTAPGRGEALIERSALPVLGVRQGDSLAVRVPGGKTTKLLVAGIAHDAGQAPGWQDNAGYAYISPETAAFLGDNAPFDELTLTLKNGRKAINTDAEKISKFIDKQGFSVNRVEVSEGKHPHADQMQTMLLLLTFFFVLAMALSGTLVANVLSALLAKQTRQIGVMRAIGGSTRAIWLLYGWLVLGLAVVGVAIGLPLGMLVSNAFCTMAAQMLNIDLYDRSVSLTTLLLEIGIGLAVPLLFAALPIRNALTQTTREALNYTGATVGKDVLPVWLTRLVNNLQLRLPQLQLAQIRLPFQNAFRRRSRLMLTVLTLSIGGAVLLTALNLYRSIEQAMDASLARRGDTIDLRLLKPMPADSLLALAESIPGVTYVETWGSVLVSVELTTKAGSGPTVGSSRYAVLAPPANSHYWHPTVSAGLLPKPTESGVLVIGKGMLGRLPGLTVGATATLLVQGKRLPPVRVVAVIEEIAEPTLYTTPATMNQLLRSVSPDRPKSGGPRLAGALRIETKAGQQNAVSGALEEVLVSRGAYLAGAMTNAMLRQSMLDHVLILLICLTSAAIAILVVGALGMGTSLSLNIIERWREIGVIRAMGGSNGSVFRLLLTEGFVTTALSMVLAVLLSLPLTALVGKVIGAHGLYVTLPFVFRLDALALWLLLAALITGLTVWLSAQKALTISVREVLAYE